jgi:probable F420-dependent oxidoreductase
MAADGLGVFLEALPVELVVGYAVRAEAAGFDSVWLPEITFGDAFVPAAATATRTSRLEIATGVVGIWSRSPVTMAMTAATLHAHSGERLILGLGLQARSYVNDWHGARYERPLRAMREYLTIVREILDGETVTYEGEIFRVRGFQLMAQPPTKRVPIYVAAIGPQMIRLAGELADGVLGYFWSEEYVRAVVLPNLELGAARAGRSLDGFDVACGFPSIVGDDGLELVRGQVVMFGTAMSSSPSYATSFEVAGFGDERTAIAARVAAADLRGAVALVTDEMADALTISGPPARARERVTAYRAAGLTTVALNPAPPGIWFPLFEGHFPGGSEIPPFDFPAFLGVVEGCLSL